MEPKSIVSANSTTAANEMCNKKLQYLSESELNCTAGSRTWTGTVLLPRDFKSLVSANSTIPTKYKWGLQGSNLWPSACKADALPAELRPQNVYELCRIIKCKRPGTGSNRRPPPWQGGALTSWATGPLFGLYSSQSALVRKEWTFGDSNPGPTGYEPVALTNWAKGPNYIISNIVYCCTVKADDRTRTDNLLITNQLLCQLSHIGIS